MHHMHVLYRFFVDVVCNNNFPDWCINLSCKRMDTWDLTPKRQAFEADVVQIALIQLERAKSDCFFFQPGPGLGLLSVCKYRNVM